jgi:hypothetical protein
MSTYLTAFNNLVLKFNDDLIYIFPEENDFKVYKRGICMLNSANAKKICILFKNYSIIYRTQIEIKDENFFLNNNYEHIITNDETGNGIESIINKLKFYWNQLNDSNKEKIWDYLTSLLKLSDLID